MLHENWKPTCCKKHTSAVDVKKQERVNSQCVGTIFSCALIHIYSSLLLPFPGFLKLEKNHNTVDSVQYFISWTVISVKNDLEMLQDSSDEFEVKC